MSRPRRLVFIAATVTVWGLMGLTLWGLLGTLETGCQLLEQRSGLWAECFAPAAQVFIAAFAMLFVCDLVRVVSVLWRPKPDKE